MKKLLVLLSAFCFLLSLPASAASTATVARAVMVNSNGVITTVLNSVVGFTYATNAVYTTNIGYDSNTVIVAGAGSTAVNGTYHLTTDFITFSPNFVSNDMTPEYSLGQTAENGSWYLYRQSDSNNFYYTKNSDLHADEWVQYDFGNPGALPIPSVDYNHESETITTNAVYTTNAVFAASYPVMVNSAGAVVGPTNADLASQSALLGLGAIASNAVPKNASITNLTGFGTSALSNANVFVQSAAGKATNLTVSGTFTLGSQAVTNLSQAAAWSIWLPSGVFYNYDYVGFIYGWANQTRIGTEVISPSGFKSSIGNMNAQITVFPPVGATNLTLTSINYTDSDCLATSVFTHVFSLYLYTNNNFTTASVITNLTVQYRASAAGRQTYSVSTNWPATYNSYGCLQLFYHRTPGVSGDDQRTNLWLGVRADWK